VVDMGDDGEVADVPHRIRRHRWRRRAASSG
jgi:hypothetical protein